MAEKNSEERMWSDPKDYGLPYVEVKPLHNPKSEATKNLDSESKEKKVEQVIPVAKPEEKEKTKVATEKPEQVLPVNEKAKASDKVEAEKPAEPKIMAKKPEPVSPKPTPKKSNSWVVYAAIIGLLLVSTIVWQLMKEEKADSPTEQASQSSMTPTESPANTTEEINNTSKEENQVTENQDYISNSNALSSSPQESTETGTTIDRKEESSLIRIEAREARPRYFIVVGSLPNERLAIQESDQYRDRTKELYLISPYDEVSNYRLAIGKYNSFSQASSELDKIKENYTEALWILKY